jgi:four helix bundle protein
MSGNRKDVSRLYRHDVSAPAGMNTALLSRVQPKISRPEDLVAYQTADELANLVDDITPRIEGKDRDWCDQIRRSTAKTPAQISEGFCRYLPRDGANYYRIARSSLVETQIHLKRGLRRKHLTPGEFDKAWQLSEVALKTTTGLLTSKLAQIRQRTQVSPRGKPR